MSTLSRRRFLRTTALGTAALAGGAGSVLAAKRDFSFIVINDSHYKDERCAEYFESAFSWVRENAEYDFVLMCGDLATDGKLEELQGMKGALELLGKPAYPIPGNHDYADEFEPWTAVFGRNRLNYTFTHRGWTFMGIDATQETKSSGVAVKQSTVDWITAKLRKIPKKRPIVGFCHFPFGKLVPLRLRNADGVLGLFSEHNLVHIYSGHFHGYTRREHGSTILTTDKCFAFSRGNHDGTKQKGFFQAHVRDGVLSQEFVEVKPA